jgi:hypothetical protein
MQERGGVNLYVYALNDPIKYTDQLGADPDESLFTADSCQQPTFLESLPRESDQQILQDQIDELDIEIAMLYVGQGLEKGLEILQTSPDDVPAERTEAILRYLWDVPDEPTAYEYRTEAIQRRSELLDQQKDITIPYGGHVPQINPMQLHKPTISGPYKLEF